ncbi:MAG TPA: quinate 5-dehydrogenase [Chthonomonadaceae bacterium]|nr:quinate 5-dehydrogenase [Chthonomonadaceae bacterium]
MKRVVSISLGSSKRDKKVHASFFGTEFEIERIGTNGDMQRYRQLVTELDGKVDAFGVGGTDIYLYAGQDKRYVFREPYSLMAGAKQTPFVDGSGLKHTLERETIAWLQDNGSVDFTTKRVLLVSAVDRFGMAEALAARAKSIVFGDMLFGLGLPVPLRSWGSTQRLARILLPIIVRLPFQWFYPTGEKQDQNTPKFTQYFRDADVIAGDFLLIRRYMPEDMCGKIILTNTTTAEDVEELKRRGVTQLITTTPVFDGRSFGTNVMEAVLVVLMGKRPEELTPQDYLSKLKELGWTPRVQELNPAPAPATAAPTPA